MLAKDVIHSIPSNHFISGRNSLSHNSSIVEKIKIQKRIFPLAIKCSFSPKLPFLPIFAHFPTLSMGTVEIA